MGDWIIGALINIVGSVAINFGTNLLKLGHDQREKLYSSNNQGDGKFVPKSVMYFQTWRIVTSCSSWINSVCIQYCICLRCVEQDHFSEGHGSHNFYCLWQCLLSFLRQSPISWSGETILSDNAKDTSTHWRTLLPFSYAIVSGAIGSCSVLFAKSLSNMLRLTMSSRYQFHSWFTYSILLLFLCTAGFWMARLNEGLSLFDAILIVPMFQIAWTFFSICTGFVYFQEYQVFDTLRIIMFVLGMTFVFVGISLLAPDENKGNCRPRKLPMEETEVDDMDSFSTSVKVKAKHILSRAKSACSMSLGLGEETISASSVLAIPMVSSRTTGFRGIRTDRSKYIPLRSTDWDNL
uniref:Probable magnesium transporter n=1 Tax=Triticum urartu TaxID=4572 RepID=A0A8R7UVP4_TRIUA